MASGKLLLAALLSLAPLGAAPASACSVVPGYRVPTTLELATRADTILIGTITGETKGKDEYERQLLVKPEVLLKGPELPAQVSLWGYADQMERAPTPSDPRELRRPNPDALIGGCTRYLFAKGMRLLLFYERKDGELRFAAYPFARVSEDVASDDALWVKAVRLYVEIAALPEKQRKAALIARRDALRAQTDDADAQALARDIDVELAGKRQPPFD